MKSTLGLTLSLLFASQAWAYDTTRSHDREQPDEAVVVRGGDCSLGSSRSTLPELATAAAVEGVIALVCSPDNSCIPDVTLRRGLLIEGLGGPIGSHVQREGWRALELSRKYRMHVPLRPGGGRRWGHIFASWR
jgi:hypothetical protein